MLQSYWDESGHAADATLRYFGMAGLVAPEERWREFEIEWAKILRDFGLAYFHMVEFAHSQGEFVQRSDWPEERRRELLGRLLNTMARTQPRLLGAVMNLEAWRQLTDEERGWFLNPYYPCAQECIRLAAIHADTEEHDSIQIVFSQNAEFRARAKFLWDSMGRSSSIPAGRINSIVMADMRTHLPLQAADVFAYEVVKGADMVPRGAKFRYPLLRLLGFDWRAWVSYFETEQLRFQCDGVRHYLAAGGKLYVGPLG